MKVGFIGAGKVGCSLGMLFHISKIDVVWFYSSTFASAEHIANVTETNAYRNIADLVEASDTIFVTVPDGQIALVWEEIKKLPIKGKNICHCSGSLSSDVFVDGEKLGASVFSIHPMCAVSNKIDSFIPMQSAYFTIEGSSKRQRSIQSLLKKTDLKYSIISKEQKALYHLSSVMVSNMVLCLFSIGTELLEESGFSSRHVVEALEPLFLGNVKNILRNGIKDSLTGPIERNDVSTVLKHLEALDNINTKDHRQDKYKELYKILSLKLVEIAKEKHPDRDYDKLTKELKK